MKLLKDIRKETGATATEYLIILGLIAIAIISAVQLFGEKVDEKLGAAKDQIDGIKMNGKTK